MNKNLENKPLLIYEGFYDFLQNKILRNQVSKTRMLEFVINFHQKMLVWGGDNVVKAWVDFRKSDNKKDDENSYEVLFLIEDALLAIGEDMGHTNKGINKGDLLTLFINDMENLNS